MRIGQLKYRIKLQTYSSATNAETGQVVRTWADSETVWADVEWKSGDEGEKDEVITQTQKVDFVLRWRSAINANDYRIVFDNDVFDIESVKLVDAYRTWMKLGCKKRDNV